jgi:pimeloyl-ACP methyl ester carboxylesterase
VEASPANVAAVVDAVAEATGSPVDVLGHSFGGLCAFGGAALTSNIRRLVLDEGWPSWRSWETLGQAAGPVRTWRLARLATSTASPAMRAMAAARTPSEATSHPDCPLDSAGTGAGI